MSTVSRGMGIVVLLGLTLGAAGAGQQVLTTAQPGTWASKAHYLWPGPTALADYPLGGRHITLASPNGHITARVDANDMLFSSADKSKRTLGGAVPLQDLAEILWAPNSEALATTESDGGWVGTWSVTVYRFATTGVRSSRPTAAALADFKQQFPTCPDEFPNVVAVDWLDGSRKLAIVVQMPCQSSCPDMCEILGYVVDPDTGQIARRLNASEVRTTWAGSIGPRLKGGP